MHDLKRQLKVKFDITDLGEPKKIIGIEITCTRPRKMICISQSKFIKSILAKENMQTCNPVGMPIDPGVILKKNETEHDVKSQQIQARSIWEL